MSFLLWNVFFVSVLSQIPLSYVSSRTESIRVRVLKLTHCIPDQDSKTLKPRKETRGNTKLHVLLDYPLIIILTFKNATNAEFKNFQFFIPES